MAEIKLLSKETNELIEIINISDELAEKIRMNAMKAGVTEEEWLYEAITEGLKLLEESQ